jgi:hypothetical protein
MQSQIAWTQYYDDVPASDFRFPMLQAQEAMSRLAAIGTAVAESQKLRQKVVALLGEAHTSARLAIEAKSAVDAAEREVNPYTPVIAFQGSKTYLSFY